MGTGGASGYDVNLRIFLMCATSLAQQFQDDWLI